MSEQFIIILEYQNYAISTCGNVLNITTGRILKPGTDKEGYYHVRLCDNKIIKTKRIHKLVSKAYLENPELKKCVDHIDRNKKNNNILNLRYATHSENNKNKGIKKNNTSKCPGVCFFKPTNKWQVQITINGKLKHIGYYDNFNDAVTSRKYQETIHYKEFNPIL